LPYQADLVRALTNPDVGIADAVAIEADDKVSGVRLGTADLRLHPWLW
jgi:hypothetical protein